MGEMLERNSSLTKLCLSCEDKITYLSISPCALIGRMFICSSLRDIPVVCLIVGNEIGEEEVTRIAEAFEKNTSLKELKLDGE
jgi:hypothetical protein